MAVVNRGGRRLSIRETPRASTGQEVYFCKALTRRVFKRSPLRQRSWAPEQYYDDHEKPVPDDKPAGPLGIGIRGHVHRGFGRVSI